MTLLFGVIVVDAAISNESLNTGSSTSEPIPSENVTNTSLTTENSSFDIPLNGNGSPPNESQAIIRIVPIIENMSDEPITNASAPTNESRPANASPGNLSSPEPSANTSDNRNVSSNAVNHTTSTNTPADSAINDSPPFEAQTGLITETNSSAPAATNDSAPTTTSSFDQIISLTITNSSTEALTTNATESGSPQFAKTINGQPIDTPYIRQYFGWHNNFSDIKYVDLKGRWQEGYRNFKLPINDLNNRENKKGFLINDTKYILHLVACSKEHGTCNFRLNGVPIVNVSATRNNEIQLKQNYTIHINSIEFDYCDGRRFCDYHYEAYDKIDLSIDLAKGVR